MTYFLFYLFRYDLCFWPDGQCAGDEEEPYVSKGHVGKGRGHVSKGRGLVSKGKEHVRSKGLVFLSVL